MGYGTKLSLDKNNYPYKFVGAVSKQSQNGVPISSSVISLSPDSTTIEITALGGASGNSAIIGKWGSASVTGTNFDWIVQSGESKILVVPINTTSANPASVAGIRDQLGLFNAVAVKTATAQSCSVFSVEYT